MVTRCGHHGFESLVEARTLLALDFAGDLIDVVRARGIAGPSGYDRTVRRGARPGLPSRWRASVHLVEEFFCEAGTRVGTRLRRGRRIPGCPGGCGGDSLDWRVQKWRMSWTDS